MSFTIPTTESPNTIIDRSWCHHAIVCKYDPASSDYSVTFYQDGVLDAEFFGRLVESSEGRWLLFTNKAEGAEFNGKFDELVFYDRALTQAESKTHADAVTANSQIALMAFGPALGQSTIIGSGESTELFYKIGGGNSGTIDNGGGPVGPGSGTITVSPEASTDYVLTVGEDSATFTVTVLGDVQIVGYGMNANGFFELSVKNLLPGRDYDLFVSETLADNSFLQVGVTQAGGGESVVTFVDNILFDAETTPKLFYRVEDVTVE